MNVNAYQIMLEIQKIEMDAGWREEINVQQVLNAQKMKNVERLKAPALLNVDQFVRMFIVDRRQFVLATITLLNVNAQLDHTPVIHTI